MDTTWQRTWQASKQYPSLTGDVESDVVVVGGLERMGEGMPVAPRPRGAGASADSSAKGQVPKGQVPKDTSR